MSMIYLFIFFLLPIFSWSDEMGSLETLLLDIPEFQQIPVSYKGRFRPAKAAADILANDTLPAKNKNAPLPEKMGTTYSQLAQNLLLEQLPAKTIPQILETRYPLRERLQEISELHLKILPGRMQPGEWYALSALKTQVFDPESLTLKPIGNFTLYPLERFQKIQDLYLQLEGRAVFLSEPERKKLASQLAFELREGYRPLAGSVYMEAHGKALRYPSVGQLKAELFLINTPLVVVCLVLYAFAICFAVISSPKGMLFFSAGFLVHTLILGLRCYVLQRPPVSNMLETVIYVPWFSGLVGTVLYMKTRMPLPIVASSLTSLAILAMLPWAYTDNGLENLQAVLDSQYWLIIHVLLVVGSYGVFILSAVMGHIYLIAWYRGGEETSATAAWIRLIKQSLYAGLTLLIPGTILGGVWAAESWGRFWDWDPKESWAFISICIYLIAVHAYRFRAMKSFGLAMGSIVGLLAVSFTWYGVNYILGSGLHSYGFGNGGEFYYYLYLLGEGIFIGAIIRKKYTQKRVFPV